MIFCGLFFFALRYPQAYSFDNRWLLRLNPVSGILTFIASHRIIAGYAITVPAVVVLTGVFGRIFCGFFCPLGAVVDFSDRFIFRGLRRPERRPPIGLHGLKYILLTGIALAAVAGVLFPLFFDPLSIFSRFLTVFIYPLPALAGNLVAPLTAVLDSTRTPPMLPLFYGGIGIGLLFFAVLAGGLWDRRFWCQYICPTGAFLGLLSRFTLFRRVADANACSECTACAKICPTRAIPEKDFRRTSGAECILCGQCIPTAKSCTRFGFAGHRRGDTVGPDFGKRHLIGGAAASVLLLPLIKANAMSRRDNTGRLIRPPGALPEEIFNARCLACGQCMKVCPTNAIQPCGFDDGFERWSTPKIVPRIGACEEKCHICGSVCPTGALRVLPYDEKRFAKLGTAVVDKHRCLAWSQNKECLVCQEVCPYHAIDPKMAMTTRGMFRVPDVYEDLCMGCGQCEKECPIGDTAAIVVFKFGENRIVTGPYLTAEQKKEIIDRRNRDFSSVNDSASLPEEGSAPSVKSPAPATGSAGASTGDE